MPDTAKNKIKKVRKINIMYLQVDKECHVDVLTYRVTQIKNFVKSKFIYHLWEELVTVVW